MGEMGPGRLPVPALRNSNLMALKDTWQRALVYFGLAEDDRYADDDEPFDEAGESEAELEERYRDRSQVRRVASRRRDEIDEIFADEAPTRSRTRVLRSVGNGRAGDQVRVHLVIPKNFNDAQQIADKFKDSVPVILNLQGADTDLSKRLIDFASGLTYALDGGMQRIAEKVFLLTPRNVEVSAEERARLLEKGFFNQS
jgi:cell division inhibitor SepF